MWLLTAGRLTGDRSGMSPSLRRTSATASASAILAVEPLAVP
ncbi:hypothetical protein OG223_17550 [Streptomyces sp. NBC_01478]|nr:hypothetical protein [Streptomyces sp. NBC_01478]